MRNQKNNQEKGQAIFFIALAFLGLLGFVSLSIDGGRIFLDRREAQNAADTAVFAAAFAIIESKNENTVGEARAAQNGFDNLGSETVGNTVTVNWPPDISSAYYDDDDYVQVVITIVSETAFMHMFTSEIATSTVDAVARVEDVPNPAKGNAIVTLGNCTDDGATLVVNGGGNSGEIVVTGAGIFVNSTGATGCALSGSSSSQSQGISAPALGSPGSYDYSGDSGINIGSGTTDTGYNSGKAVEDPFAEAYEEPTCTGLGSYTASGGSYVHSPGNVFGSWLAKGGTMNPGIYCVYGQINMSGQKELTGEGVILVLHSQLNVSGQAGYSLSAPTSSNCLPDPNNQDGDTWDSCTYQGFVIYMADGNCADIDVSGNGGTAVTGIIYAPCSTVYAKGGGSEAGQTEMIGQIISKKVVNAGNGSLQISYDGNITPDPPPEIQLVD